MTLSEIVAAQSQLQSEICISVQRIVSPLTICCFCNSACPQMQFVWLYYIKERSVVLVSDFKVVLIDDIWFHSSFSLMAFCGHFFSLTVTATTSDHADMFELVLTV